VRGADGKETRKLRPSLAPATVRDREALGAQPDLAVGEGEVARRAGEQERLRAMARGAADAGEAAALLTEARRLLPLAGPHQLTWWAPYWCAAARRAYPVVLETAPLQRFLGLRTNALSKLGCHCRFVKRSTSRV
jgi:hypothetical protein